MSRVGTATPLRSVDAADDRDPIELPLPHTEDDRAYLMLMYREHAEQARQQESHKTVWTAITGGLLVGLLVVADVTARHGLCGILICITALVGLTMQGKHHERYELHLRVMRGFRGAFAKAVRREIPAISYASRLQHNRQFRPFRFVSLRAVWAVIYLAAFATGALMAWGAEPPRLFVPLADSKPAEAQPAEVPQTPSATIAMPPGAGPSGAKIP